MAVNIGQFSHQMKRRLEAKKNTENVIDGACDVLRKISAKRTFVLIIRKRQLKFWGHIMKKQELENLTHTWHTEGKGKRAKHREIYLIHLIWK